jgi:hypothetical protein
MHVLKYHHVLHKYYVTECILKIFDLT